MSFSEERVRLETRRDESGDEKRKISELIDHLDTKKLETIRHTFTSISIAFTEVFKKLGTDITINFALDESVLSENLESLNSVLISSMSATRQSFSRNQRKRR